MQARAKSIGYSPDNKRLAELERRFGFCATHKTACVSIRSLQLIQRVPEKGFVLHLFTKVSHDLPTFLIVRRDRNASRWGDIFSQPHQCQIRYLALGYDEPRTTKGKR